jgi:1-aminocyclopropane-1-carboxylate deaminase
VSLASFPRYPLLFGPSPVHPLERLTAHLGGARLWAKREDCNSGIAYGGNKTRKLEYLLADAFAQDCDTLVSIGGVQSNHTRQVAAVAARAGLRCVLVQESWVDWPDPVYDKVGNILLSRLAGADVRLVRSEFGIGVKQSWEQPYATSRSPAGSRTRSRPRRPTIRSAVSVSRAGRSSWRSRNGSWASSSPPSWSARSNGGSGATSSPSGELRSMTGSTQAGMLAGFPALALADAGGRPRRVLGVDGSAKPAETRDQITRIARSTATAIGLDRDCVTTRSSSTSDTTRGSTAYRTTSPSTPCGWRPGPRG